MMPAVEQADVLSADYVQHHMHFLEFNLHTMSLGNGGFGRLISIH